MKLSLLPLSSVLLATLAFTAVACGTEGEDVDASESNQTAWKAPAEGSCQAKGILRVANESTLEELDDTAKLDRRVAENIIAGRPIATIAELDAIAYVGTSALAAIDAYAGSKGYLRACDGAVTEVGVISDLDETVIPEAKPDLSKAPFPGVKALYHVLESRQGGAPGDVHYVTARKPERVVDVPEYLKKHGMPDGHIDTGEGGAPWIVQPEKVKDIVAILEKTGDQRFVFFGDTANRDPEVYREVTKKYPGRVIATFINKVNKTVPAERTEGQFLHESYADVAAILYGLGTITRDEAKGIMSAAKDEGLAITTAEMEALLDKHAP